MKDDRRIGKVMTLEERNQQKEFRRHAKIGRCRICESPAKYLVIDPFFKDERCEDCFAPTIDQENNSLLFRDGLTIKLVNVTLSPGKPNPKGIVNTIVVAGREPKVQDKKVEVNPSIAKDVSDRIKQKEAEYAKPISK